MSAIASPLRIGIDLGGTKIEGLVLDADKRVAGGPIRIPSPRDDYDATLAAIARLVCDLEGNLGVSGPDRVTVGIGIPGSIARATGLIQNANSTWLNGRPLPRDLTAKLGRTVRIANDANCFALSEAIDGAGRDARSVFGVILGTGCGGGLVVGRQLIDGPMGIAGEWGHNSLPWPQPNDLPGPQCWCGRSGCMEAWVSGPALAAQYGRATGAALEVPQIAERARNGDPSALAVFARHTDRLARGLAHVMNIFDPEVVILGGGLSNLNHLYGDLPAAVTPHLFTDHPNIDIRPPRWGDSSGVRGAAWLWE